MKYRKLGNTNLNVSLICLGTMTWGTQNSEKDAFEQMDYSIDQGINFFDTAELYSVPPTKDSYGKTETMIGNWFEKRKNRDKIILASKIASKSDGLEWIRKGSKYLGFDKNNMNQAIDASLRRLKTDYIDLYQLHWPERSVPKFGKLDFESCVERFKKSVNSGLLKICYSKTAFTPRVDLVDLAYRPRREIDGPARGAKDHSALSGKQK